MSFIHWIHIVKCQFKIGRGFAWGMTLMLLSGLPMVAQVSTAHLTAEVVDSTSAHIAGASVRLTNILTGAEERSNTNRQGMFSFPGTLPGTYSLEIECVGFSTVQFTGLVLNVGDNKSYLIKMKVGGVAESITIDASGMTPNSTEAAVSTVVDHSFVANTPLNGRSFQDLISMTPGVSSQTPQAFGAPSGAQGDFSVNGQNPNRNAYSIDGVSADLGVEVPLGHQKFVSSGTLAGTTAIGTTQSLVSIDALQEFRVLTSNYSTEYGRTSGGQFALLTRSGTEHYHGSLYAYDRHSYVDAEDWYLRYYKARDRYPYQQQDFGGTFGGPATVPGVLTRRDKTFFFLSYEGVLVKNPIAPLILFSPSNNEHAPMPVRKLLWLLSSGTVIAVPVANADMTAGINKQSALPGAANSSSARIDHIFSPHLSSFIRYQAAPSRVRSNLGTYMTSRYLDQDTLTLGFTARLTPAVVDEFRLGYGSASSRLNSRQIGYAGYPSGDINSLLGIPSRQAVSADFFLHYAGAGDAEVKSDSASGNLHQWNLHNTLFLQKSHHLVMIGLDGRNFVSTVHPPELTVEADFFSSQAVMSNSASALSITRTLPASPAFHQYAAFLQDEWHAAKSITVSAGLRWDVAPAPHGSHGADAYTALGDVARPSTLSLAPRGTPLWNTGWFDLAPRVGAAWLANPHAGRELVIRAGGGVYFDASNRSAIPAFSALGFSSTLSVQDAPVPVTEALLVQSTQSTQVGAPYTHALVYAFPRHLAMPYSLQWNLAVEQAIGKSQTITTSYIGSSGRRMQKELRSDVSSSNANFGEVVSISSGFTSSYNATQLKYQRAMAHGLQALVSYTWSHTLDYGSPDSAWAPTYGNSDYDLRHHFEGAGSWSQPPTAFHGIWKQLCARWGIDARFSARSAFPFSPLGNIHADPATGNRYFSGVDLVPGRPLYLYGAQYAGGRVANGGPFASSPAFTLPAATAAGNAPRNILRGYGNYQINIALRHNFELRDKVFLQMRGEAYNILNHPVLGYIDPSLTNALFGHSTLMLNQSFGPSGSLYQPGGPRTLQLSMRLNF